MSDWRLSDFISPQWQVHKTILREGAIGRYHGSIAISYGPIEDVMSALQKTSHSHQEHISLLCMVINGSVKGPWRKNINGGEMAQLNLPLKNNKAYTLQSKRDTRCFTLAICGELAQALNSIGIWKPQIKSGAVASAIAAVHRFQAFGNALENNTKMPSDIVLQLSTMIQAWYNDWQGASDIDDIVERACQILITNPSELSDAQLAEQLNISARLLHKRFLKHLGISPSTFQRHQRITNAVNLLSNGYSVAQTAEKLGFMDASSFSKAFKRVMGQAPSVYCGQE